MNLAGAGSAMITTKAAPTLLPAITGVAQALPSGTLPTPANHPDPRKAPLSHEAGSNTPPTMLGSRPALMANTWRVSVARRVRWWYQRERAWWRRLRSGQRAVWPGGLGRRRGWRAGARFPGRYVVVNRFVRWLSGPRPAVLPVRAFRAWRARTTRALSVARLLRSGCGSLRGGYLRSLRHTELGQYRRDVVVDCLR